VWDNIQKVLLQTFGTFSPESGLHKPIWALMALSHPTFCMQRYYQNQTVFGLPNQSSLLWVSSQYPPSQPQFVSNAMHQIHLILPPLLSSLFWPTVSSSRSSQRKNCVLPMQETQSRPSWPHEVEFLCGKHTDQFQFKSCFAKVVSDSSSY
jgi:hypothetical protein